MAEPSQTTIPDTQPVHDEQPPNKKARKNPTARDWVFTSFDKLLISFIAEYSKHYAKYESDEDPGDLSVESQAILNTITEKCKYFVGQVEKSPQTGKLHVQGFFILRNSGRMGTAKKAISDNTAHLEIRHGDRLKARDYCMKPNESFPNAEPAVEGPIQIGDFESEQGTGIVINLFSPQPFVCLPLDQYLRMLDSASPSDAAAAFSDNSDAHTDVSLA